MSRGRSKIWPAFFFHSISTSNPSTIGRQEGRKLTYLQIRILLNQRRWCAIRTKWGRTVHKTDHFLLEMGEENYQRIIILLRLRSWMCLRMFKLQDRNFTKLVVVELRKERRKFKMGLNIWRNVWVVHHLVILCWIIWIKGNRKTDRIENLIQGGKWKRKIRRNPDLW